MIIGLTGKYCAGKNHVASLLEARGLPVLDVDKLGYQVLETEKNAIFAQFGNDLQMADGSLNRRLLGQRVFGKPEKLAALEEIIHPPVNRLTEEWIRDRAELGSELNWGQSSPPGSEPAAGVRARRRGQSCVINAALLHKSAVFNQLDRIILVAAPIFTRFLRARRRDKLSWLEIIRRFTSQKDFNSQYLAVNAEIYIVENSGLAVEESDSGTKAGSRRQKLECQIDRVLEGIN